MRGAWLLKGGTALNLLHLDVPRLSVDIDPAALHADPDTQDRIRRQPMLIWKAQHVREHKRHVGPQADSVRR